MLIATLALASALLGKPPGAHFVDWSAPGVVVIQKGVAVGTPRVDERLIIYLPTGNCRPAVRYSGAYGDWWQARSFLRRKMHCRIPWNFPVSKAKG